MKNIRYVFSAYTCKTKISFFLFFPPPAASTKVFALWKNKFLTPYTCDLVEISFQYQTKKKSRVLFAYSHRPNRSTCNAFLRRDRDVYLTWCARPWLRSSSGRVLQRIRRARVVKFRFEWNHFVKISQVTNSFSTLFQNIRDTDLELDFGLAQRQALASYPDLLHWLATVRNYFPVDWREAFWATISFPNPTS